jgi:glucokinase-like ROK family protein
MGPVRRLRVAGTQGSASGRRLNGVNLGTVKGVNRSALLLATRALQPVSRAELASVTGLNPSTVSKIVDELASADLLVEEAPHDRMGAGRPARLLYLNNSARSVVGVDISREAVTVALVDLGGEVAGSSKVLLAPDVDADAVLASVIQSIESLLSGLSPERRRRVVGIGVGAPGPLRHDAGTVVAPPNFPHFSHVPVRDVLADRFGLPASLENDANACALAEQWFGVMRDVDNFLYLAVGSGVGAGIVINGQLYRGHGDMAGEIGHTSIDPLGPRCDCGNRGCLELYTSERRLLSLVEQRLSDPKAGTLRSLVSERGGQLSAALVYEAAALGDASSQAVLSEIGFYLGAGIVNAINMFDPEAIVIGRSMAAAGRHLLDPICSVVRERSFPKVASDVPVVIGTLGDRAPVVGAATLVLSEYYANPLALERGGRVGSSAEVGVASWAIR